MSESASRVIGEEIGASLKRAYRLYVSYKTDTLEYRRIAESHGLSTGELNTRMCARWNDARKARAARRAA